MANGVIFHGIKASEKSPRFGREAFELWPVTRANSPLYWNGGLDDWTRWFDTHHFEAFGLWPGLSARRGDVLDWYRKEPAGARPIYMQRADPSVPAAVPYPLLDVQLAHLINEGEGPIPCRFFGCMIDYLFGLALTEGKDPIVLNGVGMSTDPGHQLLHRTILYWIGYARGRGVEVYVEGDSIYRNAGRELYGYERYSYAELDALMQSHGQTPAPDSDLDALRMLARSWRAVSRSSPQCAAELEHLAAVLQRIVRSEVA